MCISATTSTPLALCAQCIAQPERIRRRHSAADPLEVRAPPPKKAPAAVGLWRGSSGTGSVWGGCNPTEPHSTERLVGAALRYVR